MISVPLLLQCSLLDGPNAPLQKWQPPIFVMPGNRNRPSPPVACPVQSLCGPGSIWKLSQIVLGGGDRRLQNGCENPKTEIRSRGRKRNLRVGFYRSSLAERRAGGSSLGTILDRILMVAIIATRSKNDQIIFDMITKINPQK